VTDSHDTTQEGARVGDPTGPPVDPGALLRSREYRVLLVFAALIGVLVSLASWVFLELVHGIQQGVYVDLPGDLGFDGAPWWWPLPWLAAAGFLTAFAIERLPGRGGHDPSAGLKGGGPAAPIELPGILLAALATLGLGLVLGPEAPLIALGTGLAVLAVRKAKADAPQQVVAVLAAAGSFAAISTVFGSPVIGAVIIIEAAGLGGPTLPLVLLPGLMAAGIGSLVFIGMGSWTGLSESAWALSPLALPSYGGPDWNDFVWAIVLAVAVAAITLVIVELARWTKRLVAARPFLLTVAAGLAVGGLAIAYSEATGEPADAVLFSGQDAFASLIASAPTMSLSALALLVLFKGLAWGVSLGNFRGGPTFPALFLGAAGGLLAAHLPGFAEPQAVAVCMGAACVAILRLPLASIVIALVLTSAAGVGIGPLVIVAVVVAYLTADWLSALLTSGAGRGPRDGTPATAGPETGA
jgi:H+/Cl- antiporter ClcA